MRWVLGAFVARSYGGDGDHRHVGNLHGNGDAALELLTMLLFLLVDIIS